MRHCRNPVFWLVDTVKHCDIFFFFSQCVAATICCSPYGNKTLLLFFFFNALYWYLAWTMIQTLRKTLIVVHGYVQTLVGAYYTLFVTVIWVKFAVISCKKSVKNGKTFGKFTKTAIYLENLPSSIRCSVRRQVPRKTGHDTQNFKRVYSLQIWCQMKTERLNFHDLWRLTQFGVIYILNFALLMRKLLF